jgi:hypothetical protein
LIPSSSTTLPMLARRVLHCSNVQRGAPGHVTRAAQGPLKRTGDSAARSSPERLPRRAGRRLEAPRRAERIEPCNFLLFTNDLRRSARPHTPHRDGPADRGGERSPLSPRVARRLHAPTDRKQLRPSRGTQ